MRAGSYRDSHSHSHSSPLLFFQILAQLQHKSISRKMGFGCCATFLPPSSHLMVGELLKSSKLSHLPQNRRVSRSQRASNIRAYFGLTTPPYELDALEPYMSRRTLEIHWGKHHRGYVDSLNKQLEKNDILYGHTRDELVKVAYNGGNPFVEFNNAAQVWNHDFFWGSMQPGGGGIPDFAVLEQIEKDFGSFTNFREEFKEEALTLFGSGWVWLVLRLEKEERRFAKLAIVTTTNAVNPIIWDDIPIINLDMWEHAYYLDYKNDKAKYIDTFFEQLVSWESAADRMARGESFVNLGEPNIPMA